MGVYSSSQRGQTVNLLAVGLRRCKSYRPHQNMKYSESKFRSIVKSIAWRIIATLTTWAVAYYFIGTISGSLEITLWAAGLSMVLYYIHERVWNKINWGKN